MASWFDRLEGETRGRLLALLRRSERTVAELAGALGISDNAVRVHVAALQRDGLVEEAGLQRSAVGKPAQLYRITGSAEELFPKAYAFVLGELLVTLEERSGRGAVEELLRAVGARAALPYKAAAGAGGEEVDARVRVAADVLRALGGDVEVEPTPEGWLIRGFGCPLSGVSGAHPVVCALAERLVEEIVGRPVAECCRRNGRPRCAFSVSANGGAADGRGAGEPSRRPPPERG